MGLVRRLFRPYRWGHLIALALLAGLVLLRGADPEPLTQLRHAWFDELQRISPAERSSGPIVIVAIDEASLDKYGQWPWPRTLLGKLIHRLKRYGTAAVAFDIVFSEPDRLSPELLADTLPDLDDDARERMRAMRNNDEAFAAAIKTHLVVLGQALLPAGNHSGGAVPDPKTYWAMRNLGRVKTVSPSDFLITGGGAVGNIAILRDAAQGLGMFTLAYSSDTIVRQVPLVVKAGNQFYPTLSLELLRVATRQQTIALDYAVGGVRGVLLKGLAIPTDPHGMVWLRSAAHDPGLYVSAGDVLDGTVKPDRLAGRLAFVGATAVGLGDHHMTPIGTLIPGVELHAQLLQSILEGDFLTRPGWTFGAELVLILLAGLLLIVLIPWFNAAVIWIFGLAVIAAQLGLSWWLFSSHSLLLDALYPAIAAFLLSVLLFYLNYLRLDRTKPRELPKDPSQQV